MLAAQAAMALGWVAPLLWSPDVWGQVDGLEDLVLDLRSLEVDLRSTAGRRSEAPATEPGRRQPS